MNLKITEGKVETSRAQMKEIKRLDHNQLNYFLTGVYQAGARDGEDSMEAAATKVVVEEHQKAWAAFLAAINSVKGIGETRRGELKKVFEEEFNG